MKKSIIALAVAGALTAPLAQADATLYGVAQFRLIDEDTKSLNADMAKTRLGVKGTVDNDVEGLETGFQFEWEFSGDEYSGSIGSSGASASVSELRKSLVYLKGDFGQVTFGKQNNPAAVFKKADIMGRASANFAYVADRVGNSISYASPDLGGVQLLAGIVADGAADSTSEDVDTYTVGATFGIAGLDLALTHLATNKDGKNTDIDVTSFGVGYTMGDLYLGASYSDRSADSASGVVDGDVTQVAASYGIGKTSVYGQYEALDNDGSETQSKVGLGVSYALGSSASVALETFAFDDDAEAAGNNDQTILQYTLSF